MPELKEDQKIQGQSHREPIRQEMMPLDSSSLFLPFGCPVAEYLLGDAPNQNGTRALLRVAPIEFPPTIRWTASAARALRTTGFGERERSGIVESAIVAEPEPAVADFLLLGTPGPVPRESDALKLAPAIMPAIPPSDFPVSRPRLSALPLRPRIAFGPAPAAKAKTAPTPPPPPKPAVAPSAKAGPAAVAPPKPSPALAAKAPVPPIPAKASVAKPVAANPPSPKPAATPAPTQRVNLPVNSPVASPVGLPLKTAARAPEPIPTPPSKPAATSAPAASAKPGTVVLPTPDASATAKTVNGLAASQKAPAAASPATAEARPPKSPEPPKPAVVEKPPTALDAAPVIPAPVVPAPVVPAQVMEPHLSMGDEAESSSFLSRIPLPVKIALAVLLMSVAFYFAFGKSGEKAGGNAVAMGEQGWTTEWTSDPAGSRRARQITLYRPSAHMEDYRMQFVGQIESKALGWVFRAADTKNYYGMKLEQDKPGSMLITHFAVVDGRESSYSQRPVAVDSRPGTAYRVTLDVSGPRFTASVGGEPVDFWTDNRLKAGAVGFMNERDERAVTSSVQFSFPQGSK